MSSFFCRVLLLEFIVGVWAFGCLNGDGEQVDWWVMYKESEGDRAVYFGSDSVINNDQVKTFKIRDKRSPLVRTVYSSGFPDVQSGGRDHPFHISWNDQQANRSCGSKHAHAKGFLGVKRSERDLIESFFIQHSLPKFPASSKSLFNQNITSKAQHFLCISMRDVIPVKISASPPTSLLLTSPWGELDFSMVQNSNFFKVLWKYASVVNVAYNQSSHMASAFLVEPLKQFRNVFQFIPDFQIFRPFAAGNSSSAASPRSLGSFVIESTGDERIRLRWRVFSKAPGLALDLYDDVTSLLSIHHEDYFKSSGTVPKTGHFGGKCAVLMICQSHVDPSMLGVNEKMLIDRPDFQANVHVVNSSGIQLPLHKSLRIFPSIIRPSRRKEEASVSRGQCRSQPSLYVDHSKWSVNISYGMEGAAFPSLLCFYDLNRSAKQARRGGGAFCINSSMDGGANAGGLALWSFFLNLRPQPATLTRFINADISTTLSDILQTPVEAGTPLNQSTLNASTAQPQSQGRETRRSSRKYAFRASPPAADDGKADRSTLPRISDFSNDLLKNIEISMLEADGKEIRVKIPCPYKYSQSKRGGKNEARASSTTLSQFIITIVNGLEKFALDQVNEALADYSYKLVRPLKKRLKRSIDEIVKDAVEDDDVERVRDNVDEKVSVTANTPHSAQARRKVSHMNWTPNTLFISRKGQPNDIVAQSPNIGVFSEGFGVSPAIDGNAHNSDDYFERLVVFTQGDDGDESEDFEAFHPRDDGSESDLDS